MTSPIEQADRSKRQSRGWSDDMDSHMISRRLAIVEELYATWLALKNARRMPAPSDAADTMPVTSPVASDAQS
jgi:hypothetical protein